MDKSLTEIIKRFAESDCSWLSTMRPDGRVHAAPIWHIWRNGRVYIVTKPKAVKVRNIQANPSVTITHPDPLQAIIIDGQAAIVDGMENELRPLFKAKYDWDIVTDVDYDTVIEITPTKLLAWGNEGAGFRKRWRGEALQ